VKEKSERVKLEGEDCWERRKMMKHFLQSNIFNKTIPFIHLYQSSESKQMFLSLSFSESLPSMPSFHSCRQGSFLHPSFPKCSFSSSRPLPSSISHSPLAHTKQITIVFISIILSIFLSSLLFSCSLVQYFMWMRAYLF